MPIIAKDKGGANFAPINAGMHHAVCYGVVDIGTQPQHNPQFKAKRKIIILWEIPGERIEIEKDGVKKNLPRAISKEFTLSLSDMGNLRPMLESWRGRAFTKEELAGFDVANVIGANCLLNVIHETKGDKTYGNIASVAPLMNSMKKIKQELPNLTFSLDEFPRGTEVIWPENLPEWIQTKIKQSEEYEWRSGAHEAQRSTHIDEKSSGNSIEEDCPF